MNLRRLLLAGWLWAAASVVVAAAPDVVRWRRYEDPMFPTELRSTLSQSGFVDLAFTFDATGRITDRVALAASHPAFVAAVFEAVRKWEVDTTELARPARRETIRFEFRQSQNVTTMNHRDAAKAELSKTSDATYSALSTLKEHELSRPMKTLVTVAPEFPPSLAAQHAHGTATVSFVVDATGQVRVPTATDASDPAFAESVLAAIRQWHFTPPQEGNLPIQVLAERTFRFGSAEKK